MNTFDSKQAHGTSGSPQLTFENGEYEAKMAEIEHDVARTQHLAKLMETAPVSIPSTAGMLEQQKQGYQQVKYTWTRGDYTYTGRWHTRTPLAPLEQGNSWVIERVRVGIGAGPNARPRQSEVLVGKTLSGQYVWVAKSEWNAAIRARKNGTATVKQEEMLKHGHWKEQ